MDEDDYAFMSSDYNIISSNTTNTCFFSVREMKKNDMRIDKIDTEDGYRDSKHIRQSTNDSIGSVGKSPYKPKFNLGINCPICESDRVSACKCALKQYTCERGHTWYFEGEKIKIGKSHH